MFEFDYLMKRLETFSPTVIKPADVAPTAVLLQNSEASLMFEPLGQLIIIVERNRLECSHPRIKGNAIFIIGESDTAPYSGLCTAVVLFPEETDAVTLYSRTSEALYDLSRLHTAKTRFYGALESHEEVRKVARIAEEIFNNPVAVFDISSRMICCGMKFELNTTDAAWLDFKKHGSISLDFANRYSYDDLCKRVKESADPFFFDLSDRGLTKRLLCRVLVDGVAVGHCTVLETETPLNDIDVEIMRCFASIIGIEMEHDNYLPFKNTVDGVILQELYSGKISDKAAFLKRTAPFKWVMQKYYLIINIFPGDMFKKRSTFYLSSFFLDSIMRTLPIDKCTIRYLHDDERIIVLLNTSRSDIGELLGELDTFLKSESMTGTISRCFTDIMEFKKHVDYTQRLVESALISGIHNGLLDSDTLFFQNIAFILNKYSSLEDHCLSKLIDIRKYDAREGTDYFNTIKVYLESGQSVTKSAEKLYMHRNTIIRRIDRFCQLTGLNLAGDDIYNLFFTYKLLEYKDMVDIAHRDTAENEIEKCAQILQ